MARLILSALAVTILFIASAASADTILVIGDSLGRSDHPAWPERLFGDEVANFSLNGSTSETWSEWAQNNGSFVDSFDEVYVSVGTVEALSGDSTAYAGNMASLVSALVLRDIQRITLVGTPYPKLGSNSEANGLVDDQRDTDLALCSQELKVICSDDLRPLVDPVLYQTDQVHFSPAGHEAVKAILVPEPPLSGTLTASILALAFMYRRRASLP